MTLRLGERDVRLRLTSQEALRLSERGELFQKQVFSDRYEVSIHLKGDTTNATLELKVINGNFYFSIASKVWKSYVSRLPSKDEIAGVLKTPTGGVDIALDVDVRS